MPLTLALVVGGLFAAGFYMILRRSLVKFLIGLALLSHAANVLVFGAAGLSRAPAPVVPAGELAPPGPTADPLPQALVLTAIVIGFGVLAFAVALMHRVHGESGSDDLDSALEERLP